MAGKGTPALKKRGAAIQRKTREVDITGKFIVDGAGTTDIKTPFPFLDHMLDLLAFHGFFDLSLRVSSDLSHHGIEDIGIAVGDAVARSIDGGKGIRRYGTAFAPMDKTLARVVVDISGRPSLFIAESLTPAAHSSISPLTGKEEFSFEDMHHFLEGLCLHAKITMHIDYRYDGDTHHLCEAIFKALGMALDSATTRDSRRKDVASTKGIIDL
ncbi:MAG: imidazoleglycerol-phosphate dehydratase [Candidatus Omnitrophica bacterium]|nr:imidazoleglycerol-phosphate dehydratase [Candidatus Omnitrophota bacterium]